MGVELEANDYLKQQKELLAELEKAKQDYKPKGDTVDNHPNLEFIIFGLLLAVACFLLLFWADASLTQPVPAHYGPCNELQIRPN